MWNDDKAYSEEKVGNVMGDEDGDAHVGKVEAIAQPDQGEGDDVMQNQLLEVLSRFLQHEQQHQALLSPVAGLQKIIGLEQALVAAVWKALEHARRVEVPDRRPAHDVHAKGTVDAKVHGRVGLFHEASLLASVLDSSSNRQRAEDALHDKLTGETEDNGVKGNKGKVGLALAVLHGGKGCDILDRSREGVG